MEGWKEGDSHKKLFLTLMMTQNIFCFPLLLSSSLPSPFSPHVADLLSS